MKYFLALAGGTQGGENARNLLRVPTSTRKLFVLCVQIVVELVPIMLGP